MLRRSGTRPVLARESWPRLGDPMGKRILFVDDEAKILEGLRIRLRRQRARWDMQFVQGGTEALTLLAEQPVDIVVSDMRMPGMDGATLLKHVQERYPRTIRIVLSGHAEVDTALRAVAVAHQFLTKPSEPGVLESVLERACDLQALINAETVQRIVGRVDSLPCVPRIYLQLVAALTRENVTVDEVARILKQDMSMCAKTLQIVNSAFFRLPRTISSIDEAVVYLGFNSIKEIVLAAEVFQSTDARTQLGLCLDSLQTHALLVANVAASLGSDPRTKQDLFVAGLLHDIGKLVLAVGLRDDFEAVNREVEATGCLSHVAEERTWGATHAEVGGYLLGLWGLPCSIVEAVASHHAPRRVKHPEFGMLAAIHVADALVHEETGANPSERDAQLLDCAFVESIGVAEKLDGWREIARTARLGHRNGF